MPSSKSGHFVGLRGSGQCKISRKKDDVGQLANGVPQLRLHRSFEPNLFLEWLELCSNTFASLLATCQSSYNCVEFDDCAITGLPDMTLQIRGHLFGITVYFDIQ